MNLAEVRRLFCIEGYGIRFAYLLRYGSKLLAMVKRVNAPYPLSLARML